MTESRLKKSLNAGGREDRSSGDASRQAPEEKFPSNDERRKMWTDEWTQSAMPKTPEIPGWHLCWLSTNNTYDSIDKRMRLGYVPVKADECSGFENHRVKAGEHVGYISCNEMLLFKIPMDVYQDYMTHFHHDIPREEEEKVKIQIESLHDQRDSNGKLLMSVEGDGMGNFNQQPRGTPVFHG